MFGKALLIVLAFCAYQGHGLTEVRLEDRDVHIIRNPFLGSTITIPKQMFDILSTCHLTYPNGQTFEAYPQSNLPDPNVFFNTAAQPFTACSIGIRNVPTDFSGTYELTSSVVSSVNNGIILTRQRFNIKVTEPSL